MTKKADTRQLDMFVALLDDIPTRDQRETMERPFFSLQKTPRTTPIDYQVRDVVVRVDPHQSYGMATIWDADILIWAASQITAMGNDRLAHGPTISFHPYNLLKAIHRGTSGKDYEELRAALMRLTATLVTTSIRAEKRGRLAVFHWLEGWGEEKDEEGRVIGMTITLPQWLYQGIIMRGGVLKIAENYFDLSGGLERWLYRVARKHGGHQEDGWSFAMAQLHHKSGSTRELKKFAADIREIVRTNQLPEYELELIRQDDGQEAVRMRPRPVGM